MTLIPRQPLIVADEIAQELRQKIMELEYELKNKNEEYILCAAIWYKDFESPVHTVKNIDRGVVLCGYRHGHIIGQLRSIAGKRTCVNGENASGDYVQGFLTSKNRFLDREEAHKLFVECGGKPDFKNELYSEDLY